MLDRYHWIVAVALLSAGCTSTTDLSNTHISLHGSVEDSSLDGVELFQIDGITGFLAQFSSGNTVHVAVAGATENLGNGYQFDWHDVEVYTDLSLVWSKGSFVMQ